MRTGLGSCLIVAGTFAAIAAPVQAAVIIDSNFNSASLGAVADGATVDGFSAKLHTAVAGSTAITIVEPTTGDRAFTLTDNLSSGAGSGSSPYLKKSVTTGISSDGTGNNFITGSFEFTRLAISSGTESSFRFLLNKSGSTSLSTNDTVASIRIDKTELKAGNGSTLQGTLSGFSPAIGTTYVFEIDVDLSSTVQDIWRIRVRNTSGTLLFSSADLNTPAANITPADFLFTGGVNGTPASPDPFVRIDDIHFEASHVPEPALMGLAGVGGVFALRRRASRR